MMTWVKVKKGAIVTWLEASEAIQQENAGKVTIIPEGDNYGIVDAVEDFDFEFWARNELYRYAIDLGWDKSWNDSSKGSLISYIREVEE